MARLDWSKLNPQSDVVDEAPKPERKKPGPKPKKLSKKKDPNYVMSSFYIPRELSARFDRALTMLKLHGITMERSEALEMLVHAFIDKTEEIAGILDGDPELDTVATVDLIINKVSKSFLLTGEKFDGTDRFYELGGVERD